MPIRVALHHTTRYRYDREINLGAQVLRLRRAPHCRTSIPSYALAVTPDEHFINWQQDPAGNHVARLVFLAPTRQLELSVELVADLATINPFDFFLEASAEEFPFAYDEALAVAAIEDTALHLGLPVVVEGYPPPRDPRLLWLLVTPDPGVIEVNVHPAVSEVDLVRNVPPDPAESASWEEVRDAVRTGRDTAMLERYFLTFDSPMVRGSDAIRDYASPSFTPGRPVLEATLALSSRIHRDLAYEPGATTIGTTPEETLALRRGVCQDFAHLAIGCLRAMGLAARYVSGYLVTGRSAPSEPALTGADASHAWLAVWTPEHDWVDVDPTNDQSPTDRHITLAWGRDYGDVSPIRGVILGGGDHKTRVSVEVTPIT